MHTIFTKKHSWFIYLIDSFIPSFIHSARLPPYPRSTFQSFQINRLNTNFTFQELIINLYSLILLDFPSTKYYMAGNQQTLNQYLLEVWDKFILSDKLFFLILKPFHSLALPQQDLFSTVAQSNFLLRKLILKVPCLLHAIALDFFLYAIYSSVPL